MAGRHYTGDGGDGKGKEACRVGTTKKASSQRVGVQKGKTHFLQSLHINTSLYERIG